MKPKVRLVLTLLGGFEARAPAGPPLALPTRKAQALLACLAIPVGRHHSREKLATLLWGDMPDAQARGNLRQALSRIHKALAEAAVPALRFEGDGVALDPSVIEVDVAVFERLAAGNGTASLERAAETYRGDLLEGLALRERAFDEWLTAERERLRALAVEALGRLLAHQSATGADDRALSIARRLLELDPLQEAVHRLVMRLYWQGGHRAAALRQYQICADVLQRELRAEPEPETRRLHQEILRPAGAVDTMVASPHPLPVPEPAASLVGREAETAGFRALLDRAGAGESRVAVLVGEAGIGKSRLLDELAALARRRGFRVLSARSYETEQVLPFGAWVEALRAGGVAGDRELLGELSPAHRRDLAALLPELDAGPRAGVLPRNPLPIFTALARLVAGAGARHPVAIVLDDFHWADEMSVRLLGFLGRRLTGSATLLAVSIGAEGLAEAALLRRTLDELSNAAPLAWTDLAPLSQADTLRLVRLIAPSAAGPGLQERVEAQVWRLAEGNPFVALEAARAWYRDGAPPLDDPPPPERVRRSSLDRLERLDDRARRLAGVAAMIGGDFDADLLLRASGLGDDEAVSGFDVLMREGILRRDGERLGFRHERVRLVAAGLLSAPRRVLIHRRIAESLEALSAPDRLPHREIGRHYRSGEVWDRALAHLRTAGRLAVARAAFADAAECYAEALDAWRRSSERLEAGVASVEVQIDLGSVLHQLGDVEGALGHYRTAEAEAVALADPTRAGWALIAMSYAHASLGRHRTAIELAHRSLAGAADDPVRLLWGQLGLVRASFAAGDYPAAVSVARAILDTPADEPTGPALLTPVAPDVGVRGFLVLALSALGQFDDAQAEGAEAMRSAEKVSRSADLVWANCCLGRSLLERGDAERAVEYLERAFALTREWGPPMQDRPRAPRPLADVAAAELALVQAATGRLESALGLVEAGPGAGNPIWLGVGRVLDVRGRVLLAAGRLDDAESVAIAALTTARARGEPAHEAWALRLLAGIAHRRRPGDGEPALGHLDAALALADRHRMRPLRARCQLERAVILDDAGRRDEAGRSLALARDEFRALAMPVWLARARRFAFLRESPGALAVSCLGSSQEQDGSGDPDRRQEDER